MAEPYFPGGPRPQGLGKTLEDFKRLGKGLLVGETADILGLPADLAGLYFDMRFGGAPQGIQTLIDRFGSEALAKRFMGEDFPEFGMNLESAGRVLAPGALLSKGIASARLAARLRNRPPSDGGFGGPQFAMAGVGASKLPPPTSAERLAMTAGDDLPAVPPEPEKAKIFEDDYLKPDVAKSAEISRDGIFFSNLLQEIENIGTGQSQLGELVSERLPIYKKDLDGNLVKDKKGNPIPEKGPDGRVLFGTDTRTRIKGIDFNKNPTGAQILGTFKQLKGGINNRLYKEAEEVGLIRYLELNPKEVFGANAGKEKLYNIASQFTPELDTRVYRASDGQAIESQISQAKNDLSQPNLTLEQKENLTDLIADLQSKQRMTQRGMSNMGAQRIDPGGDAVYDVVHTIFGTGSKGDEIVGSSFPGLGETPEVKKSLIQLEDFFKAAGDTESLKKLQRAYSEHGFDEAVPGGYYAHTRAVDGFMGFKIGPGAPKLEDSRFINEVQINQGLIKERKVIQDSPERTAEVQRNIARLDEAERQSAAREAKISADFTDPSNVPGNPNYMSMEKRQELVDIEREKQAAIRKVRSTEQKKINNKNDILLNSTLMDVQQILKIDEVEDAGILTFSEKKASAKKAVTDIETQIKDLTTEAEKLNRSIDPLKQKVFKVDVDFSSARAFNESHKTNKAAMENFFDEDLENTQLNPALFESPLVGSTGDVNYDPLNVSTSIKGDDETHKIIDNNLPASMKKFLMKNFDVDDTKAFLMKRPTMANSASNMAMVDEVKRRFKFVGDTFERNPLHHFLTQGSKELITDQEMMVDHYKTVQKLVQEGKLDADIFDLTQTIGDDLGRQLKNRTAPLLPAHNLDHAKYVQMKLLDNPNYFDDPKNVSKFFKDAYRNHGKQLEKNFLKADITRRLVNSNKFRRLIGEDNIKELAQRVEVADSQNLGMFDPERKKIYQDFLTDAEIQMGSKTAEGTKIMKEIVDEAVDDYTKRTNTIPTPLYQGAYRIRGPIGATKQPGAQNVVDWTYNKPKKQNLLKKFVSPEKGTVDFNFITPTPENLKAQVKNDILSNLHLNIINENQNPLIDSMAHQESIVRLEGELATVANRYKEAQKNLQTAQQELRPLEKRGALLKLVEDLGDKVPPKIKESLKQSLAHVDPNQSFSFQKNPPVQNSQQGLELMVHRTIADAKKEGKRYVIFPKLADYAAPRTSGDPKKYNFAAGAKQLGSILEKYGDAYFKAPNLYSSASDLPTDSSRIMEIGKVRGTVPPPQSDADFFRVIDLSKIDSNIKIPRFKKGGILSKFRKVA